MAKSKQAKNSKRDYRRSHYAIDKLPDELRKSVEEMITEDKWPPDFGSHYEGTPRYVDVAKYCKDKGHSISHSAIGRFAKQTKVISARKILNDLKGYTRAHLGTLCMEYANTQADIEVSEADSEGREALEKLQRENIKRIEGVIATLKKINSSLLA